MHRKGLTKISCLYQIIHRSLPAKSQMVHTFGLRLVQEMTLRSSPEGYTRHERAAEIEPTLDSSFKILTTNYVMACLCWNPVIVTNQRWSFLANQK